MAKRKLRDLLAQSFGADRKKLALAAVAFAMVALAASMLLINTSFSSIAAKFREPPRTPSSALTAAGKLYEEIEAGRTHNPLGGQVVELRRGDTLMRLLNRHGVDGDDADEMIAAMRSHLNPKSLRAGQKIQLLIDQENRDVQGLEYLHRDRLVRVRATPQGWEVEQSTIPSVKNMHVVRGAVADSLYESGVGAGLTPNQIMELATLFEYDIDFFSDFQRGDEFSVLFDETQYEDGRRESGDILAAELQAGGEPFRIFRFARKQGKADHYDNDGKGRRRAFLRAPLSFTRISSRYNPRRRHPIFRTVRPHRAIDYAAPAGTPVVALGNGRVTHAGWKGGYGKMVEIRHANGYATRYAHFSKIAAKIRFGRHVAQGQVVGYVGQTGHATGPHLHFEMLRNGRKINFLSLRIPTTEKLRGKDLQQFMRERETMLALLQGESAVVAQARDCSSHKQQTC